MASSPTPSCDDYISTEELFQSFMDVAMIAEQEIQGGTNDSNNQDHTNHDQKLVNHSFAEITFPAKNDSAKTNNNNEVLMPLPLLLRKSADPIYESVMEQQHQQQQPNAPHETVNEPIEVESPPPSLGSHTPVGMQENTDDGTIVTVCASPVKKAGGIPQPDYPGAVSYSKDYDVVIQSTQQPPITDIYATVDKQKKTEDTDVVIETRTSSNGHVPKDQIKQESEEEEPSLEINRPKLTENGDNQEEENDDDKGSSGTYQRIASVTPPTPVTEVETLPLSEYAIIESQNDHPPLKAQNSDYESVSDLKIQLVANGELSPKPQSGELSPEIIAFGPNHRTFTEGQAQLYQSCLTTIDRAARSSEKKRHFFGFGKHKQQSLIEQKLEEDKSSSMNRRNSTIPSLCSGYLFKQGGTGFTPKNWRLRWFELKKDNCLYYYKNEQDPTPAGAVILTKYSVTRAVEANKRFAFKLAKGGARTYYFAANSEEEMRKWMKNLGEAVSVAISDQIPECSLKNVSVPATSISEPDCHGFLWKQGNFHKSWRRRYCVLKYGCLFYYEEMSDQCAIGVFKLHNYTISDFDLKDPGKHGIQAVPPARKMRTYFFYAESEIDGKRWLEAIKHSILTRRP